MTSGVDALLEATLKRDRWIVLVALGIVIAAAWAYLLSGAGMEMSALEMTRMSGQGNARALAAHGMMTPAVYTPGYTVLMFFMWWVMMVAMMVPSAAPMILLFTSINRRQIETGNPHVGTGFFTLGYLLVWAFFSVIAVGLQWGFQRIGVLSPMLVGTNVAFGGILLVAAGIYQLTPVKQACLRHCRSPLEYLANHWRPGALGALRMGAVHGAICMGCCWFLMGLLFLGGVMNLYWIAGIAVFVLLEKTIPAGRWLSYASGIVLLSWGVALLAF
jgi:predicted metal-binding membrane protein